YTVTAGQALPDGAHLTTATAKDAAGNESAQATVSFSTLDRPPSARIASGPAAATRSTDAAFAFESDDPLATFECALDGADFAACANPLSLAGLAEGSHSLKLRAVDLRTGPEAAPWNWTIDRTAPAAPTIG